MSRFLGPRSNGSQHEVAQVAGRDPASLPVTIGGAPDDLDKLKRFCDLGAARVNVSLMSDARDEITAADLAVYPIYAGRKALPDNAGLKHLQAWGERIGSRPGVQKGMKLEN